VLIQGRKKCMFTFIPEASGLGLVGWMVACFLVESWLAYHGVALACHWCWSMHYCLYFDFCFEYSYVRLDSLDVRESGG